MAYVPSEASSGMSAEPMAANMIRLTAGGSTARRSRTMAITTTERMRENSTALRPFSCEVNTLRRQATVKNISGSVSVELMRMPR